MAASIISKNALWSITLKHSIRCMSQYPNYYIRPKVNRDTILYDEEVGTAKEKQFTPVQAAKIDQSSSVFYDHMVSKFVNTIMRDGRKALARDLLLKTFENIKRIQLKKYNSCESEEERKNIECNPLKIFHLALENTRPVIGTQRVKRGGVVYQVPVPLKQNAARFKSMKWLWLAGTEKDRKVHFPDKMAYEFIDAANNTGKAVKMKQDLHKLCESNRAFAHYRWG